MTQPNDTILLPLSRGYFTVVDADVPEEISRHKWTLFVDRNGRLYARGKFRTPDGRRTSVMLHRMVMGVADPAEFVDHVDGDGLNNRRINLRPATNQQNMQNRRINANNRSGFKGVSLYRSGKWVARIRYCKRDIHLGYFETAVEAALTYDQKASELFGRYARLNFPE